MQHAIQRHNNGAVLELYHTVDNLRHGLSVYQNNDDGSINELFYYDKGSLDEKATRVIRIFHTFMVYADTIGEVLHLRPKRTPAQKAQDRLTELQKMFGDQYPNMGIPLPKSGSSAESPPKKGPTPAPQG